jgi:hypothetical protein
MLYPLIAIDKGLEGYKIGILLVIPAVFAASTAVLLDKYCNKFGPEKFHMISGLVFGSSYLFLAIVSAKFSSNAAFVTITVLSMMCAGIAQAGNSIAETDLVLKYYSIKDERDKLAIVRNAAIYSVMIAAIGISFLYTIGKFMAAFMFIGGVQIALSIVFYWRLQVANGAW